MAARLFYVTCRAVFDQAVIDKLDEQGVYFTSGGSTTFPPGERRRHHLVVEAENEQEARDRAREFVEQAGGDASDIVVVSEKQPDDVASAD